MPDLQQILDQFQAKIDDLETADDWHDNNRVMEAQAEVISDAEQLGKALHAVTKECDRLKKVASNTVHEDSPARHIVRANAVRQAADSVLEVLQDAMEDQ